MFCLFLHPDSPDLPPVTEEKVITLLLGSGGAREGLAGASAPPRKTKAPPYIFFLEAILYSLYCNK